MAYSIFLLLTFFISTLSMQSHAMQQADHKTEAALVASTIITIAQQPPQLSAEQQSKLNKQINTAVLNAIIAKKENNSANRSISMAEIHQLICEKADPNAIDDRSGQPVLFTADAEVATVLLAAGAHVDEQDIAQRTALINETTKGGSLEKIKILLKAGANVNAIDEEGWNAVLVAILTPYNEKVVKVLVAVGADLTLRAGIFKKNIYEMLNSHIFPLGSKEYRDRLLRAIQEGLLADEAIKLIPQAAAIAQEIMETVSPRSSAGGLLVPLFIQYLTPTLEQIIQECQADDEHMPLIVTHVE